jgi:hypothetical protein
MALLAKGSVTRFPLLADVMALTCFSPRRAIILSGFYNWYRKDIL